MGEGLQSNENVHNEKSWDIFSIESVKKKNGDQLLNKS